MFDGINAVIPLLLSYCVLFACGFAAFVCLIGWIVSAARASDYRGKQQTAPSPYEAAVYASKEASARRSAKSFRTTFCILLFLAGAALFTVIRFSIAAGRNNL